MEPLVSGKTSGSSEPELRALVVGIGDAFAALMGPLGEPMRVPETEAITVSKPASRILARNPVMDKAVQVIADPASLVIAVMGIALPRYAYVQALRMGQIRTKPQGVPTPPPPPPPRPAPEGAPADTEKDTGRMDTNKLNTLKSKFSAI